MKGRLGKYLREGGGRAPWMAPRKVGRPEGVQENDQLDEHDFARIVSRSLASETCLNEFNNTVAQFHRHFCSVYYRRAQAAQYVAVRPCS